MNHRRLYCALILTFGCAGAPAHRADPLPPPQLKPEVKALPPDPEPWRMARPGHGKPGELRFPEAEQVTLASGLSVLVVQKAVPVASLQLVFRHGGAACPPGKSGLAALTARMLTEGTRKHPGLKLAEEVERLGTTLDADAGRDTTTLSLSALTQDLDRAVEILAEVVQEPAFLQADFERVQSEWLDGLRAERQSPDRLASLTALGALLGKPHGSPVSGTLSDVQKLSVKNLRDFHHKAYKAADAALIVVGDTRLDRVHKVAERAFKKLARGQSHLEQPFNLGSPPPAKQVLLVDRPGAVQSAIVAVQPLPRRSEPGYETRELLTTLLGGLFTSRLNLNLREEHAYTYGAHAQNVATKHWGALYVATSVRSDVTAQALVQALKELSHTRDPKLGKPISQEELDRARADLVQSLGARLEHGARIAGTLSEMWSQGLAADYYRRYPALLAAETTDSVTRAASILNEERLTIVIVGDRSVVEAPLRKLGFQVVAAPPALTD